MIDSIPEGFKFKFMASPVLESRDDPRLIRPLPAALRCARVRAREVEAMEFIRYVLSNEFMSSMPKRWASRLSQAAAQLDTSKFTCRSLHLRDLQA